VTGSILKEKYEFLDARDHPSTADNLGGRSRPWFSALVNK